MKDYRLEKTEIIGRSHYEVFPEIPQRWRQDHQDCLAGKVEVLTSKEDSFVRADGRLEWLRWELRPWFDFEGEISGLLMFSEVITERKILEQQLLAEKELAQITLSSIGDGVITTDALGKVSYLNPVAERLTGWSLSEATGKAIGDVFRLIECFSRKPLVNPVNLVLKDNRVRQLPKDTLLVAQDGTEIALEDSVAPIQDTQGNLIGTVVVFRDVTKIRELTSKLSWQATHDTLTGLSNRLHFETQVKLAIEDSQVNKTQHVIAYLDLDRFKSVNDICGHLAGDELLKQITALLKQRIRTSDVFARLGGDEFGILFYKCNFKIAQNIAEQLRRLVRDFDFVWQDRVFKISVSIGLAAIAPTTNNLTEILSRADTACYAAKRKGRNSVYLSKATNY
ncbi:diguanylate cyclase domain-containing protein [Myxosarcina sp. GI1]|uniref:diguanylate cyclase domain-containing protein n=1 Tax=Myxosarcina sp. GI1 TaxID=1541065 RepID=UPI0021108A04|nr:diguanylate cyclase [Myxosarcina sp. GI1]